MFTNEKEENSRYTTEQSRLKVSKMAFFNLTQLGVQHTIKESMKNTPPSSCNQQQNDRSSSANEILGRAYSPQQRTQTTSTGHRHISDAQGSHLKYTQRLTKHQRSNLAPNEIYRKPVTTSQDHGWWIQDGSPHTLPWARAESHKRVNSEMSRFVDEMKLTNRHFSLF